MSRPEPAINFAEAVIDPDRLERSLLLAGDRVGRGQYHVTGGTHEHADVIAALGGPVRQLRTAA
jgi:hypothetical protein